VKGISSRITPLGWNVNRVHYSADPDKDPSTPAGAAWYENICKGMRARDVRKEYEIDYGALSGQLVFPEMDESIHVVRPYELDRNDWTCWLGADPHPRAPHAFVWLVVNRYGQKVVLYSYWPQLEDESQPRLTVAEYAENLKLIEASSLVIPSRYKVMDVAGKSFNATEKYDFFDAYRYEGIYFQPAKRNRDHSGYDLIGQALKLAEYNDGERPELTIMAGCGDNDELIRELRTVRFREWKQVMTDKDPPEEVEQKQRHLVDCLSYILLDDPRFIDLRRPAEQYNCAGRVVR
jgi:hypothetical protein